jgi:uncharacterized membrane protein YkvA (DUF1232 family)
MDDLPQDHSATELRKTTQPWVRDARQRAKGYIDRPERLGGLLDVATQKLKKGDSKFFNLFWAQLRAVLRLLRAYWTGRYRDVSRTTLITLLGAVIYFVMPIDAIPDWIVGIGFLDDAYVLGMAVKSVKNELDAFLAWESAGEVAIRGGG